jgi:rubrerythrin
MKIECEICGSYAELDSAPLNNICPICSHIGSLFISEEENNEN